MWNPSGNTGHDRHRADMTDKYWGGRCCAFFKEASNCHLSKKGGGGCELMFVARVLAGHSVEVGTEHHGMVHPHLRDTRIPFDKYDSAVNNDRKPSVFLIYNSDQCYPEFLIEYTS